MKAPEARERPSNVVRTRPAVASDAEGVVAIYNDAVLRTTATFDLEPRSVVEQRRRLAEAGPRHPFLVAELDGAVVGWACLIPWSERPAYAATAEVSVYVRADQRGRGIGRALLNALVDGAVSAGLHTLLARVADGNPASLRLHESMGFDRVGTMREVGRKFDRWIDVHLMQRAVGGSHPSRDGRSSG
jgi:L-amino acid N-acyltransferase YncA